jgi:creatinine amidohydrolase
VTSLLDLPSSTLRARFAGDAVAVLTVNPVEYHGPHLSLSNDRHIAHGVAHDVARALGLAAVDVGDIPLGVEPCPGPGSRHTDYAAVRDAVVEACRALIELGCKKVILSTFHGSPLHNVAVDDGVRFCAAHGVRAFAPLVCVLERLMALEPRHLDDALAPVDARFRHALREELPHDLHAGFFETSLTLHYAPETVAADLASVPPCQPLVPDKKVMLLVEGARRAGLTRRAAELRFVADALGWMAVDPFPGYTSRPHLANAASGAAFAKLIVDDATALGRRVLIDGEAMPRPPLSWLAGLTLGGRLGARAPKRHAAFEGR